MEFANFIMLVITIIALIVVIAVLWYGIQHDPHTSIRSPESSRAAQMVQKQAEAARRKLAEMLPDTSANADDETQAEDSGKKSKE
ncbi:MAG: hypothetical protein EA396_08490 [Anaerolineaceae bacterium]|nr:MAG: hypothetical protein EA396_08490 [Anaerolineaceae bacterium]